MPQPIADWKDESSYKFPTSASMKRWAFEFLRRNHGYQNVVKAYLAICDEIIPGFNPFSPSTVDPDVLNKLQSQLEQDVRYWVYDPPRLEDESVSDWCARVKKGSRSPLPVAYAKEWGLNGNLFDPWGNYDFSQVSFATSVGPRIIGQGWGKGISSFVTHHEEAFLIDYRLPLLPQLNAINKYASSHQGWLEKGGFIAPPPNKQNRSKLYPTYLRCLDADDAGVKHADIAEVLCPKKDQTRGTGYRGNSTVTDWMQAAKSLRDGDYKYLPMLKRDQKNPKF